MEKSNSINNLKEQYLAEIQKQTRDIIEAKGHDYGNAWIELGLKGIFCQINSKYFRLKSLIWLNKKPQVNESTEDTLVDMINYCTLALILIKIAEEKQWSYEKLQDGGMA